MLKDEVVQIVLEYLQNKYDLSDLEKDIIDTITKYKECPFDRKGSEQKVTENNLKYPDMATAITLTPGISVIPFSEVADEGVRDNLRLQIEALCIKEYSYIRG